MKKFSDLTACIDLLRTTQRGNDGNPKQKQAVENAIHEVNRIRRNPNLKRHEVHKAVRKIAESLIDAFFDRNSDWDA